VKVGRGISKLKWIRATIWKWREQAKIQERKKRKKKEEKGPVGSPFLLCSINGLSCCVSNSLRVKFKGFVLWILYLIKVLLFFKVIYKFPLLVNEPNAFL